MDFQKLRRFPWFRLYMALAVVGGFFLGALVYSSPYNDGPVKSFAFFFYLFVVPVFALGFWKFLKRFLWGSKNKETPFEGE